MMKGKKISLLFFLLLVLCACGSKRSHDPLGESGRTTRTENLLAHLKQQADTAGYLFGHVDATLYGVGWSGDSDRSDVLSLVNDQPALLGLDISGIGEKGQTHNSEGISFSIIRKAALSHFDKGGVVLLTWHPIARLDEEHFNSVADSVAEFVKSLVTPYKVHVPVLLRLLPDNMGWWGSLSEEDYQDLWQSFVSRMEKNDVVNALYVYSFSGTMRYPGDENVDFIEWNELCPEITDTLNQGNLQRQNKVFATYQKSLRTHLSTLKQFCKEHDKPMALMTGFRGLRAKDWWTAVLEPVVDQFPLTYILFGPNGDQAPGKFFVPYPGQQSASDFVKFYNAPRSLFLHDVNALYI